MPNSHEFWHSQPLLGVCVGPENIKTRQKPIVSPILGSKIDILGISVATDISRNSHILTI